MGSQETFATLCGPSVVAGTVEGLDFPPDCGCKYVETAYEICAIVRKWSKVKVKFELRRRREEDFS